MFLNDLKTIYQDNRDKDPFFVRNLLKESIQYYVLHFISQSKWSKNLIFKGGTCLRIFFDLPRLSEDLDFDIDDINLFDIDIFTHELQKYFVSTVQFAHLETKLAGNKRTLYLKFPILSELGMTTNRAESNTIFVRIDVGQADGSAYTTEISVKSSSHFSLLIKRYSLPDLMASKIAAVLTRERIEGKVKIERTKGRDYYDLIWYLEKNIQPNWKYLAQVTGFSKKEILEKLKYKINNLDSQVIEDDLAPFFQDNSFVKTFSGHIKEIYLAKMLK
ncbi:MAG: nucleotidyl transferase AbiEii/AbiGii toxin family protein [Patescibacteria group bacterium]